MNKKYLIIVLSVLFLLISGICYSCAYSNKADTLLLSEQNALNQNKQAEPNDTGKVTVEMLTAAPEPETAAAVDTDSRAQSEPEKMIYVHICGAVEKPGVYGALDGARLIDIITLSGGLTGEAAADFINQALKVSDGQRYYIPTSEEVENRTSRDYLEISQSSMEEENTSQIDINQADEEELMTLPGIGKAKARSIIAYRNTNGKFKTIEDLMKIPGIKEGLFNQLASLIIVN